MIKYYWCWWTKTEQAWCLFKQSWIKTISLAWSYVIWWNLKPIIIEYFWRMNITEPEDKNDREITNECISESDLDFLEWKCTEYVNGESAVYSWIFHNILCRWWLSISMRYVSITCEILIGPYYWRGYKWEAWDVVQNFLCNVLLIDDYMIFIFTISQIMIPKIYLNCIKN